jgi:hypothetical protein
MFDNSYIAQSLRGAWLIMLGRKEGLALLDASTDGFWRSFLAIVIGIPALLATCFASAKWSSLVSELSATQFIIRSFIIDLAAWLLPFLALALVIGRLGLGSRFAIYVVAMNWASLIILYFMLPIDLIGIFVAQDHIMLVLMSAVYLVAAIIFLFLITHLTFATEFPVSIALFLGTLVFTFGLVLGLQNALGVS